MITTQREKSVDADVLGPAYSFSQPADSGQELAHSLRETWDTAVNTWVQSLQKAWQAPFSFGSLMWGGLDRSPPVPSGEWKPDFSITREGNAITVSAMLPGATEDDVEVEILDGKLVIAGECNFSEEDGSSDQFSESIDLLNLVDSQSVQARISDDGFLEIGLKLHDASGAEPGAGTEAKH